MEITEHLVRVIIHVDASPDLFTEKSMELLFKIKVQMKTVFL